ncbi:MAG TPA: hypothetical protein VMT28_02220 [Terriglobales bacterium]|jgi:hypothetical protein|nr:hypothetical protein [Terriglobales bacterium]
MRSVKLVLVVAVCVLGLSLLASAGQNQFGVADTRQITFDHPIWVGDTLLPSGDYQVTHSMQGDTHIMVFKQQGGKKPVEVSVKCKLVPLPAKAVQTEKIYVYNDKNERVLQALIFRGDMARHQF